VIKLTDDEIVDTNGAGDAFVGGKFLEEKCIHLFSCGRLDLTNEWYLWRYLNSKNRFVFKVSLLNSSRGNRLAFPSSVDYGQRVTSFINMDARFRKVLLSRQLQLESH